MKTTLATAHFGSYVEFCLAKAEEEIAKRKISFDDVERETGRVDTNRWGSDASRRKRNSIVWQFTQMVMKDSSLLDKYELR